MTTEQKVAQEILQESETIEIGGRVFSVAPPSVATLIKASEAVSQLPRLELDKEDIVSDSLRVAKDCRKIGDILAVLILGARQIRQAEKVRENGLKRAIRAIFGKRGRADIVRELADDLLEGMTPHDLQSLAVRLLSRMQLSDFFALTTFLQEVNMTRPTKVVRETTASGRS